MDLERQIQYDKIQLAEINTAIRETQTRFDKAINKLSELNIRMNGLSEQKRDYEIRISVREKQKECT